jgi:hypothetical protein
VNSIDIRSGGFPVHLVRIHPRNAVLQARNVRYFVFSRPFADPQHEGMKLIEGFPQNQIWIYDAMPERALIAGQVHLAADNFTSKSEGPAAIQP